MPKLPSKPIKNKKLRSIRLRSGMSQEQVAEKLGIKVYDKELLQQAAKDSGFCEEIFENHDERPTNSFLYSLVMDTYSLGYASSGYADMPLNHKVFLAQFDTIKKNQSYVPRRIGGQGRCISTDFVKVGDRGFSAEY